MLLVTMGITDNVAQVSNAYFGVMGILSPTCLIPSCISALQGSQVVVLVYLECLLAPKLTAEAAQLYARYSCMREHGAYACMSKTQYCEFVPR